MKKTIKEQTTRAFQVGGYNPAAPYNTPTGVNPQTGTYTLPGTGIAGYQTPTGGQTGYTPYGGAAPYFQPVQFTGPQFQTATQTTNLPTFAETVGSKPGQYDELRTYVNDAGQILQIPFKDGQPIYPIPEGYRPEGDQPAAEQPTTTPVTTTPVTEQGDGGGDGLGTTTVTDVKQTGSLSLGDLFGVEAGKAQPYKGTSMSSLGAAGFSSTPSASLAGQQKGIADALGIYGNQGINAGALASVLTGSILGAIGSVSGIGPSTNVGAVSAPAGFGAFTTEQLENYVTGKMSPVEMQATGIGAMNKSQALQRAQVQKAIRTPLTGQFGFSPGSIDPNTGQPYDANGRLVNTNGSSTGVEPAFSNVGSWVDAVESSIKSGYWGGPLTDVEYDNLSSSGKAKYDEKAADNGWEGGGVSTGKGAEVSLGDPSKGGEVSATPGGTAGTPGSKGRADYSGGYRDSNDSASDNNSNDGPSSGSSSSGSSSSGGHGMGDGTSGVGDDDGDEAYCLTEDMKVKRNGVIDFVTKVQVGDIIDNTVVTEVLHKHMREGYYKVNGELKITNDHPVLANGSWKRTEDLVLGDYINNVEVTSLEYVEQVTPTVYIGTAEDRYDVYTKGEVYTVHGQYKNGLKKAA